MTPFFLVLGNRVMAEPAGGWIERVERRGWTQYSEREGPGAVYATAGPFPGGFVVSELSLGGHRSGTVVTRHGFVVSGSPDGTYANYQTGFPLIQAGQWFMTKPGMESDRAHFYPQPQVWRPYIGSKTGAWYVIWHWNAVGVGTHRWVLSLVVEQRWHEWRWAPAWVGPAAGGSEDE